MNRRSSKLAFGRVAVISFMRIARSSSFFILFSLHFSFEITFLVFLSV